LTKKNPAARSGSQIRIAIFQGDERQEPGRENTDNYLRKLISYDFWLPIQTWQGICILIRHAAVGGKLKTAGAN
jgi:hypothetical protein